MTIGTLLFTWAKGKPVGTDSDGNRYYEERKATPGLIRKRRWVLFKKKPEATLVPPEWHSWLHYTTDAPLAAPLDKPWVAPHQANMTGTDEAYLPPGHELRGGERAKATGDYEAWQP